MPLPLTITVGAKGDTITIPANHGFNYVKLGGTGFDGNTSVYKYRLRNNFSPITITFRDATNGEDQACSPYYPSYTPESAWIPIIDGVEIYQSNRLSYVSGQNYGPGPFGYCAAGTAFGSLTFFTGIPRVMVRTNLRMPPIIPTNASRQVSSSATSLPPGYRRISLRPQQPVRTNLRVAAAASPPVKTTGTVNSPPTLSAPVIVTPTQVTTTTTTRATTTLCEPFSFGASNIGPWSQSRPGYVCSGTSYGNGTYAWALAASTRTGNTWVGPNMPRFSFDGVDDNGLEIWTFSASGWAECQVPTYTDTQTKSRTSNSITFNIGAGTLVITFTECGSNGAGITTTTTTTTVNVNTIGPTTPQTTPCLFTKTPTAIYSGAGCGCIQSKTTLTVGGCPQTVITYACAQCPTPSAPTYTAPVTVMRTVTAPSSGDPIVINQGLAQKLKAPPPGSPTPTRAIVRRGVVAPIQVMGPDFSRLWNGGKKYDLHQSVPCDSVLTKKRRYKPVRLQENASTRLAGAPLLSQGEKFGFIVGDPEMALTSFKYGNGDDTEDLAKRDLGKRWSMANWSDFANATESDLLGFMQTFGIIEEDLSTEDDAQHIAVVGWIKYQNNIITEDGENYLVVYCNKSLPSSITPVATLLSDYWVLVANTNDYIMCNIICKK